MTNTLKWLYNHGYLTHVDYFNICRSDAQHILYRVSLNAGIEGKRILAAASKHISGWSEPLGTVREEEEYSEAK